jgi:iron complex outermembrane receptor protein
MRYRRCKGSRSALLALVLSSVLSGAAFAQQKQTFDIPAEAAPAAIQRWAQQSGLQVFAADDDLHGIRTNPVRGEYGAVEAAQMLVAGTGLEVIASGENTITIRRVRPPRDASGAGDEKFSDLERDPLMEMIVTGSRIRRPGFDTLQPAVTTDAKQLERRGYTNVAQALNDQPGFGIPEASDVGSQQGTHSAGQSFVNLFSLGSQRTLVLVNGRRYVTSNTPALDQAAGSQVDLNTIPVGLIERVEVVSIGGAPVYGSDAIAGTVNIILKQDFEGLQASAQYGGTDAGGGESRTFRTLMGGNFDDSRGNLALAVEYSETEGLRYSDRFDGLYTLIPNLADTGASDGIPALVPGRIQFPGLTDGGLPYNNLLAPAVGNDFPGIVFPGIYDQPNYIRDGAGQPVHFARNGQLVPYDVGTIVSSAAFDIPVQSFGGDGYSPAPQFALLAPTRRALLNAFGHYDLSEGVRMIFEASYAHSNGKELSDFYSAAAPGVLFGPRLTFSVNNPFLDQQARDILVANLGPDATFDLNRNLNDLTDRFGGETTIDLYRVVGGLEGELGAFGETLNWDVAFNFGRSRGVSELVFINPDRLLQAADAVTDPSGNIVCADASGGCVPLNLFGVNNFSNEALQWVADPATGITQNTQRVFTANLGGQLPFGIADKISFNLGAEHREEEGSFDPDSSFRAGDILIGDPGGVGAAFPVSGEFETDELYTELVVPLVSQDWDWPVIKTASFEGAVRHVDHSLTGGDTTWSVGGRIAPRLPGWGDGLTFRGVYTEAIRSPAIRELFTNTPLTDNFDDPCDADALDSGSNPQARRANCAAALAAVGVADPASFDTENTTGRISPSGSQVGNPNLENEEAESWSVGFVYQPTAFPRVRMAVDWADVDLTGVIAPVGPTEQAKFCYDSASFPNDLCEGFRRYTAADIAALPPTFPARQVGDLANGFEARYLNVARLHFQGLIAAIETDFDVGPGIGRVGATVFYTHKLEETVFEGEETLDESGQIDRPKTNARLNLGYHWNNVDVDWQTLWRSSVRTQFDVDVEESTATHVPAYVTHNLTVGYGITDTLRAQAGVVNVLDEEIDLNALADGGFSVYDPIGRRYFLSLFAEFR